MRATARPALLLLGLAMAAGGLRAADAPLRLKLDFSLRHEHLSNGQRPWREAAAGLELKPSQTLTVYARARSTERFALTDRELVIGAVRRLGGGWILGGEAGVSDTHAVLPRGYAYAEVGRSLGGGWGLYAGLRGSHYTQSKATLGLVTLERYFGDYRLAYTFYSGRPGGGPSAPSHRLAWTWYYGDASRLGVSLSRGREVENIPGRGLLTSDVRAFSLNWQHWFRPDWALEAEAGVHRQGTLYRRSGVMLGLHHRY